MFVTPHTPEHAELVDEVVSALGAVRIIASYVDDALVVDGARLPLRFVDRAHPTPADLAQLVSEVSPDSRAIVVADRISEPGRAVLRRAGWGWLDRRGHLRIWAPGLRIEMPVPVPGADRGQHEGNPWTEVGLETVLAVLVDPERPVTARRIAPVIHRSVGAVHEAIVRLGGEGLVGRTTHRPLLPELFWEAAAHWPDDGWVSLPVGLAEVAERAGGGSVVRVDERAATLGGAKIPAAGSLPVRAYVVGATAFRKVRSFAGGRSLSEGDGVPRPVSRSGQWEPSHSMAAGSHQCMVREAPVRWLPDSPLGPSDPARPWRVGHPLVCALRLASDPARGREIVESWGVVPGGEG